MVDYQNHGTYTDADGKSWTDTSAGLIKMWEEIDQLSAEIGK